MVERVSYKTQGFHFFFFLSTSRKSLEGVTTHIDGMCRIRPEVEAEDMDR